MRKELIFAIVAGAIFGLVIAIGIWRANSAIKTTEITDSLTPTSTANGETPSAPTNSELSLTLSRPQTNDVKTANPVSIEGITKPESWVAISTEDEDFVIRSDDKGEFSQEVDLLGGINQVIITAFDPENESSVEENITLVYSTEFNENEE